MRSAQVSSGMAFQFTTSSKRHQRILALAVGVVAVFLMWTASTTRPWHAVEFKTFDLFTSLSASGTSHLPIVILAIDEPSFQELQLQWPFPRRLHAQVLDRLRVDGALAVGFDVVFAEPSNPQDDDALARAIEQAPPVVLAAVREKTESGNASIWIDVEPLDQFLKAGAIAGQAGVMPDDDFVVRRHDWRDDMFAVRLAARLKPTSKEGTGQASPELIEYVGPSGSFDTRSYYQALEPGLLPVGFFKGKVVLIGRSVRTATELAGSKIDMFNSPFAVEGRGERLISGVEIQANLLSNALTGGGLRLLHEGWSMALVLVLCVAVAGVSLRAHPGATAALVLALVLGILSLSYGLFLHQKIWLAPLFPVMSILALYGSTVLLGFIATRRNALQTKLMFSQYVPQEVVARLVAQPELMKLGGEARELTLMFTDLANFTTMSEHLSAEATVEVLTEYFNAMTPVIHRYGGTVDKFIGDAVMAFWGAPLDDPQHAEHAVRAAIDMHQAMQALVERLTRRGLPSIGMRIGLHTGRVVVGNVGSHSRFSYTVIGDAVNLAARLEGANKAFGTTVLLSGATAALLPHDLTLRHVDTVIVKGKSEAVKVYTPCEDADLCGLSAAALESFCARQWDRSESALHALLDRKPGDLAALRFLHRIAEARVDPPDPSWSGALSLDKL